MPKVKRYKEIKPETKKKVKTPMTYIKENYPEVYDEIKEKGIMEGVDRVYETEKWYKENPNSGMLGSLPMKRKKKLTA